MMRIVITGGTDGQLVRTFLEKAAGRSGIDPVALGPPEFDLTDSERIAPAIAAHHPDLVINAAAYTNVDKAEDEPELAHAINATGAGAVAAATSALGVPVVQISTDYVFDGLADRPYCENDPVNPLCTYGRTKLSGEQAVAAANPHHLIVRTAWVYSPYSRNFLLTMLRLAETRDEIGVVSDQVGNPTSAATIADGLLAIADRLGHQADFDKWGIYHLAGRGDTSWADFASEIFCVSGEMGGPSAIVRPITTADYPTKARRPPNSRLDTTRFRRVFDFAPASWQAEVAATLKTIRMANTPTQE